MNAHLGLIAATLCTAAAPASAQLTQWAQSPFSGRWIGYQAAATSWSAAEARAVALHGHLLTIRDAAENAWVRATFANLTSSGAWIGLNDVAVEGAFTWTSGEPVTFMNFASGQPDDAGGNEDAVAVELDTGLWSDRDAASSRPLFVERVAPPSSGWSAPTLVSVPVYSIGRMWPADLDLDGRMDLLVTANTSSGEGRYASILQQLDGSLSLAAVSNAGSTVFRTAIGDFDADGDIDAVCGTGFLGVFLALGDGLGGFAPPVQFLSGNPTSMVALDLDNDGRDELVLAHYINFTGYLSVFSGATSTGFTQCVDMPIAQIAYEIDAADMNGDGFVDVHATNTNSGTDAQIYWGQGTTTLVPGPGFVPGSHVSEATLADLDGDLDVDVAYILDTATSNRILRIAWNDGLGNLSIGPTLESGSNYGLVSAADLDGDGHQDLVVNRPAARTLDLIRSLGGGAFAGTQVLAPGGGFVTAADLHGDASPEITVGYFGVSGGSGVAFLDNLASDCNGNGIDDPRDLELLLASDANLDGVLDGCQPNGTPVCSGDGSAASCPCAPSTTAGAGCLNSTGAAGRLEGTGVAAVTADTLRLTASGLPPTASARLVQGTTAANGGLGAPFGDGLRCAAGSIVRIVQRAAASGVAAYGAGTSGDPALSASGGVMAVGGTRVYQVMYRDIAAYCTSDPFNTSNGLSITWVP